MNAYSPFETQDLQLIYSVLHAHLTEHLPLMDSSFFEGLQTHLQRVATQTGVDVSDHGQWAAWLRGETAPKSKTPSLILLSDDS